MSKNSRLLAWVTLPALPVVAYARGVTPYLPLNLDPDIERQVERVLILGDRPALRRPIAAAEVLEALPRACEIDEPLCQRVEKYLRRYMQETGLEFASVELSASTGKGAATVIPNAHGQTYDSRYQVAAAGYLQLGDHGLLNLGGVAYEGRAVPTGTFLSLGFDFAQLDIGYRDHWWSPTSNGSLLISTEAPTMPSVTLSNYRPLTPLGIEYEVFLARMSYTNQIETAPNGAPPAAGAANACPAGAPTGQCMLTAGYPKMVGLHLGIEPVSGLALGANRVLIYGGGAAGGQSISDVAKAFFDPATAQSTGFGNGRAVIGKQEASVVSQLTFPGRHPFSAYLEYGANDTSQGSAFLFGKPSLAFGVHLPRIGLFDITLEDQVWEPTWYVHGAVIDGSGNIIQTGYLDGISNDRLSIGNWFGDQRQFGNAVGGESQLMRVGFEPRFGGRFDLELRMLRNESFSGVPYKREYMGSLSYARPWRGYAAGGQIDAGRDVFGARYARLSAFLRLGEALPHGGESSLPEEEPDDSNKNTTEVYTELGVNANTVYSDIDRRDGVPPVTSSLQIGPHLGVGARRQVSEHQDLGAGLDADDIDGHLFLGVRALDYRYRFNSPVALEGFVGVARYQLGSPAIGWYVGAGPQWRNILPGWDLSATGRFGWSLARQRNQPDDVNPGRGQQPDSFENVYSFSLSLSHKF